MTFTTFIKRPVLSTVISIVIVILGVIGLFTLPIEQYPDIAPPTVVVYTSYMGADAETVKNSVLAPLEESINGVENMTYMTSSATNQGSANISVFFRQGTNPDMCAVNVQNRVSQAQSLLPAEVTRVGVTVMKRQTSQVIMYTITSEDGRYNYEAWYTLEIPISNGPWKLGGLPGMILEAYDTQRHYVFECIGIEKVKKKEEIVQYKWHYVKITRKEINKMIERMHRDFFAYLSTVSNGMYGGHSQPRPYNPLERE